MKRTLLRYKTYIFKKSYGGEQMVYPPKIGKKWGDCRKLALKRALLLKKKHLFWRCFYIASFGYITADAVSFGYVA